MPRLFTMPEVATGSDSATLSEWVLAEGSTFTADDVVATVETDKAVVDIQADAGGVLVRQLVAAGTAVEVGAPIALLAAADETVDDVEAALAALGAGGASPSSDEAGLPAYSPEGPVVPGADPATASVDAGPDVPADVSAAEPAAVPDTVVAGAAQGEGGGVRIFASPLARKLAREAGLELTEIGGTGPNGRIRKVDVVAAVGRRGGAPSPSAEGAPGPVPAGRPPADPVPVTGAEEIPHSRIRRTIARRLTESKETVPHFYVSGSARVDRLLALRVEINDGAAVKVSVNDLVVKAVARALIDVPEMNVTWGEDSVRRYATADVAVAVSTDDGLLTPVLRSVERQTLTAVSTAVRDVAQRARTGTLRQNELEGGSFTVSNLGMFGTEEFTGIINPPHAGLLAVGAARPEPVVGPDGGLEVGTVLRVTLSADHRPVDGVTGARWMAAFLSLLENPVRILS